MDRHAGGGVRAPLHVPRAAFAPQLAQPRRAGKGPRGVAGERAGINQPHRGVLERPGALTGPKLSGISGISGISGKGPLVSVHTARLHVSQRATSQRVAVCSIRARNGLGAFCLIFLETTKMRQRTSSCAQRATVKTMQALLMESLLM